MLCAWRSYDRILAHGREIDLAAEAGERADRADKHEEARDYAIGQIDDLVCDIGADIHVEQVERRNESAGQNAEPALHGQRDFGRIGGRDPDPVDNPIQKVSHTFIIILLVMG